MSTSDRGYFAPLSHDLRVRERLISAGIISQAEIEQYLANLPDNEGNSESLGIGQPALNTPQPPAPPAPAPIRVSPPIQTSSTSADLDDDDDDDDDEEDEVDEVAAAPAEEHAAPTNTIAVGEPTPGLPVETREAVEARKDAEAEAATEAPVEAAEAAPAEEPVKADGGAEAAPAAEAASATTEEQVG